MAIRILPRHLVNKIAAGEVIERPASVVKELVENSLDAGATAIDIAIEEGGRRLIRVSDNGCGMTGQDMELAFVPHATSKIATEDDLFHILTMGFRGEALASIAAVSHAHIVSRRKPEPGAAEELSAHEIRAGGEMVEPVRPASAPVGTTIAVRDLFFNTPARRKFLRTGETEFGHISEQLARVALPHRQVAFSLTHNGRMIHKLSATGSLAQRVLDLFGPDLADGLIELNSREKGLTRIFGLAGPPNAGRASARWQYFFVNGRYVRDRFLSHALKEAYRGLMDPSRCPAAFVFLEIDPAEVDVNVHPAKIEVRFRNGQLVHSQLHAVLRESLNRAGSSTAVVMPEAGSPAPPPGLPAEPEDDARRQSLKQALADFFKSMPPPQRRLDFPQRQQMRDNNLLDIQRPKTAGGLEEPTPSSAAGGVPAGDVPAGDLPTGGLADAGDKPAPSPAGGFADACGFAPQRQDSQAYSPPPLEELQAIQIHNSYIVTADANGVAIIDQHALHERILFEELTRRVSVGKLTSQRLLIPQPLSVNPTEQALLEERAELLDRLGIEVSQFGPQQVALQRFPSLLAGRRVAPGPFLRDLLDVLGELEAADGSEMLNRLLATMACKAAVKAGDPLSRQEMQELLARRGEFSQTCSCPHGRPTTLTLSLAELEKQFKRS
jgi:DNA mismatch repair protein MutL